MLTFVRPHFPSLYLLNHRRRDRRTSVQPKNQDEQSGTGPHFRRCPNLNCETGTFTTDAEVSQQRTVFQERANDALTQTPSFYAINWLPPKTDRLLQDFKIREAARTIFIGLSVVGSILYVKWCTRWQIGFRGIAKSLGSTIWPYLQFVPLLIL